MNVFEVVLAIIALGAVGTLVGAFVRQRKARGLTDISGTSEQAATKRVNDMRGWRYGLWHSGRAAPLPPNDSM